jgi:hypothetical protein
MPRYADKYLDELFDSSEYLDLVMLQGILATPPLFNSALPEYGLPTHFFVVVEGLAWFAQSTRSGVSTYFEATLPERQQAMYDALVKCGPKDFAERYQFGMHHWRDSREVAPLDFWIKSNDHRASEWMRRVLREHRAEYRALIATIA